MIMVQNVSVSVNLCGMCFLQKINYYLKYSNSDMDIKLGTTISASHLIRKNYSEFFVTKLQIFDVKLLQMVIKTLFLKINKKLIVSFLIQWYSVFKISYEI